jgi:hypothetical protein
VPPDPEVTSPILRSVRRSIAWLALAVAVGGVVVAFALPSTLVPDCPRASPGVKCAYFTDIHPWLRFWVGLAAILPVALLLAVRRRGSRGAARAVWAVGAAGAVMLWWVTGLVPASGVGDCPPYPRCYTIGHTYGGVPLVLLVAAGALGAWLWNGTEVHR